MINILSYVGMDLQSEVCLWTLLGLLRTIFDATLFKVNANLKQVWQMRMPEELTRPVQRVLRTMISGVILVQCFTLYVYLASYIVLLYPVFLVRFVLLLISPYVHLWNFCLKQFGDIPKCCGILGYNFSTEERPTLVLPWLLLAAIRKLLCELMSLALGLGTCVLLGPARPPCIKFVIVKLASITPAFYMWFLVFGYYHALKMSMAFKTFTAVLTPNDRDYGLELAVRRRMTKSLQGEDQLRRKLIANLYGDRNNSIHMFNAITPPNVKTTSQTSDNSVEDLSLDMLRPQSVTSNRTMSDIGTYEDWFGSEVALPRDTDRILEQFGLMLLRIAAFLEKDEMDPIKFFNTGSQTVLNQSEMLKCTAVANDDTDTPPHVGSSKGRIASYLTEYPQIFMKKTSDACRPPNSEHELIQVTNTCTSTQVERDEDNNIVKDIVSENIISYEVTRRTTTVELDISDIKLMPGTSHLRESIDMFKTVKEGNCNKNVSGKNVKCKAINTACRLKTLDESLCSGKLIQPAECSKNIRDKIKTRITENKNIQKAKTKKSKPISSSSEVSSNSNCSRN